MNKTKLFPGGMPIIRSKHGGPTFRVSAPGVKIINLGVDSDGIGIEYTKESGGGADIGNVIYANRGIVDHGKENTHAFNVIHAKEEFIVQGKKCLGWIMTRWMYVIMVGVLGLFAIDYALAWRNFHWMKDHVVDFFTKLF